MSEPIPAKQKQADADAKDLLALAKARAAFMQSEVCRHVREEEDRVKVVDWTRQQIVEYFNGYQAAVHLLRTLGFTVEVTDLETKEALYHAEQLKLNSIPY